MHKPLFIAVAVLLLNWCIAAHAVPIGERLLQDRLPLNDKQGKDSSVPKDKPGVAAYRAGLDALEKKDYKAAETAFGESMRLDPKWFGPLLGLAEVAFAQGKGDDAESWLRKAEALDPGSSHVQAALGRYYARQDANAKAEAAYNRAIALDTRAFLPRIDLADLYLYRLNRPADAVGKYRAALELQPDHAGAHYGLARALEGAKRPDEAAAEFEKAAKLAPDNPLPLIALGRLYFSVRKYDLASKAYDQAIARSPNSTAAYIGRAEASFATGQFDKSMEDYQAVIRAEPRNSLAYLQIGAIHQVRKQFAEADAAYVKAIENDPKNAAAYNNRAWMAAERKASLDDALEWSKKAVELAPTVVSFQDTLGWVYRSRGDLDRAAATLEKAAKGVPADPIVYYHLGIVYSEQQKNAQAVAALKKSLQIDSKFSSASDARRRIDALSKT